MASFDGVRDQLEHELVGIPVTSPIDVCRPHPKPVVIGSRWPTRPSEGVGAVRRIAPAAEIIQQMMTQAYDILTTRPNARSASTSEFRGNHAYVEQGVGHFVLRS